MKTIGITNEGGILVELTSTEAEVLAQAQNAAAGLSYYQWAKSSPLRAGLRNGDVVPVFNALTYWVNARMQVVQMQVMVDDFRALLHGPETKS